MGKLRPAFRSSRGLWPLCHAGWSQPRWWRNLPPQTSVRGLRGRGRGPQAACALKPPSMQTTQGLGPWKSRPLAASSVSSCRRGRVVPAHPGTASDGGAPAPGEVGMGSGRDVAFRSSDLGGTAKAGRSPGRVAGGEGSPPGAQRPPSPPLPDRGTLRPLPVPWEPSPGAEGPAKRQGDTAESKQRARAFSILHGARRKFPRSPGQGFYGPGPRSLGTRLCPGIRLDGAGARPTPVPTGRWAARVYF